MKVWHAPADGNVLVEYNRYTPWRYATGDEQDYILDIMASNGYVWDKDENHFFSNPRMIATNITDIADVSLKQYQYQMKYSLSIFQTDI